MNENSGNRVRPLRPSGQVPGPLEVWVVGINHETAPIDLREKLAFSSVDLETLATRVIATTGAAEVVVLSTCNRVEVYAAAVEDASMRRLSAISLFARANIART